MGVIVLGLLGSVAGPHWTPRELEEQIVVEDADTTIAGAEQTADVGTYEVRETITEVELDGATVRARVLEPVGAPAERPAMLFVHGAGTGRFTEAFTTLTEQLASAGVVTMVPDKRLDTYTTRHRDYVAMAQDYLRSFEVLQGWPGVATDRVGVYGESEGGWIVPVMAAVSDDVAMVALVSSPVVPPRQQAAWAVDSYLRNVGVPAAIYRAIPRAVGMDMPGGGFEYADFDVTPYQRQMTQPVFVAYGTGDISMPIVQGAQQIMDDLARAGNDQYAVRFYAEANHGLRVDDQLVASFVRDLAAWIHLSAAGDPVPPSVAGTQPHQTYVAEPVQRPAWFAQGDVLVGTVIGALAALVLAPLSVGAHRLVRRSGSGLAPGLAAPLAALGVGAVATLAALLLYLARIAHLALNYQRDPLFVQGGWVLVRMLGIATVVAACWFGLRLRAARRQHRGPVAGSSSALLALGSSLAGSAALLGVLAYWGVFPLGL